MSEVRPLLTTLPDTYTASEVRKMNEPVVYDDADEFHSL
jgi:hypothetical protein